MILFKEGIGKLSNITYEELQNLLKHIPKNWEYDYKCTYESKVSKEFNKYKYKLKLYRKCEETE